MTYYFYTFIVIIIVLLLLGINLSIAYWAFNQLYKTTLKSKKNSDVELIKELRVELLERKLDTKLK